MSVRQWKHSTDVYKGLAASVVTSNPQFWGDAAMITGSLTTSSGTASRWTIEGYEGENGDGFTSALPSGALGTGGWQPLKTLTVQGYFSIDTIPSWIRVVRTVSHSSSTLIVSVHVGP